uniref:Uncharacterized protein n=1 Tax=Pithovirus LCDPAC02 TaxID=2506601 RepID=A0A481YPC2_9VIRU|nr:MAG: hypothetical protein LCDPAC02_00160 [Pithovirus LCDPAC02]
MEKLKSTNCEDKYWKHYININIGLKYYDSNHCTDGGKWLLFFDINSMDEKWKSCKQIYDEQKILYEMYKLGIFE